MIDLKQVFDKAGQKARDAAIASLTESLKALKGVLPDSVVAVGADVTFEVEFNVIDSPEGPAEADECVCDSCRASEATAALDDLLKTLSNPAGSILRQTTDDPTGVLFNRKRS